MTWKISVQFDPDQEDVGLATATWTDPLLGIFTYSERLKANSGGLNGFVNPAIAARNAWQAKQLAGADKAVNILAALNAADPQAGG